MLNWNEHGVTTIAKATIFYTARPTRECGRRIVCLQVPEKKSGEKSCGGQQVGVLELLLTGLQSIAYTSLAPRRARKVELPIIERIRTYLGSKTALNATEMQEILQQLTESTHPLSLHAPQSKNGRVPALFASLGTGTESEKRACPKCHRICIFLIPVQSPPVLCMKRYIETRWKRYWPQPLSQFLDLLPVLQFLAGVP